MTEKQLQAKILKAINKLPGVVAFAHVVTIYSQTGQPDCYGVKNGKAFFGEVKLPGKKLTKIQKAMSDKLQHKGGVLSCVWHSVEEAVKCVEAI